MSKTTQPAPASSFLSKSSAGARCVFTLVWLQRVCRTAAVCLSSTSISSEPCASIFLPDSWDCLRPEPAQTRYSVAWRTLQAQWHNANETTQQTIRHT